MAGRPHGIELPSAGAGRLSGRELSEVCQRLLDAELRNGLVQGRDYAINLQVHSFFKIASQASLAGRKAARAELEFE